MCTRGVGCVSNTLREPWQPLHTDRSIRATDLNCTCDGAESLHITLEERECGSSMQNVQDVARGPRNGLVEALERALILLFSYKKNNALVVCGHFICGFNLK